MLVYEKKSSSPFSKMCKMKTYSRGFQFCYRYGQCPSLIGMSSDRLWVWRQQQTTQFCAEVESSLFIVPQV